MNIHKLFKTVTKLPLGHYLFSKIFCFKAPYFGTIKPKFITLIPGKCVVEMRKRRAVLNHISTVHAIAMCNLAEAAGGLCIEVTLPKALRWIPKGMSVEYLQKATTHLQAICEIEASSLVEGDNQVEVNIFDNKQNKVFRALINMYVSKKEQPKPPS